MYNRWDKRYQHTIRISKSVQMFRNVKTIEMRNHENVNSSNHGAREKTCNNEAANVMATDLSKQMTSWRHTMMLHLAEWENGHYFIKRTT